MRFAATRTRASSTTALSPTTLIKTFAYNAIGNLTAKSDVGTYTYPAAGQPRPHAVTSISGGTINTTFTYDAKGNVTSGNGLTVPSTGASSRPHPAAPRSISATPRSSPAPAAPSAGPTT